MAKRNTKQGMYQPRPPQPKRRAPAGKPTSKAGGASNARSFSRPADRANVLMVRIAAIVIVVTAVVAGTAWAMSLEGAYGVAEVIGLILLGFLAGLGIAVALRTEQIVAQVTKMIRERR